HMFERSKPFGKLELDFETMEKRKAAEYEKLDRVIAFAETRRCREREILDYFGQVDQPACGRCDNCVRKGKTSRTANLNQDAQAMSARPGSQPAPSATEAAV